MIRIGGLGSQLLALSFVVLAFPLWASDSPEVTSSSEWKFKDEMLPELVRQIPIILKDQETTSGRFGKGIWIVNDQNVMFPLAAVWSLNRPGNPYYHDADVLKAVMAAGDALIAAQDNKGRWIFEKKDGSTWGMTYMPWVYSRWARTYWLIRDSMPPERREKWETALRLGFDGIARGELKTIHNIPTHHAMGLYFASKALNRPDWCTSASEFFGRVIHQQFPDGFWSENYGPVVNYNGVYVDALGIYYGVSSDKEIRPALEKAAKFHSEFVYPNNHPIETIDERNPYSGSPAGLNVGYMFTPEGRTFAKDLWNDARARKRTIAADTLAAIIVFGEEGEVAPSRAARGDGVFVTTDEKATVRRSGPWCVCLSAYCCPIPQKRWIQDRQNFVSVFHERTGLIVGGGNTKLQPLWSTFTVGDTNLLWHKPGDENPDFREPKGLLHVPTSASLAEGDSGLDLQYGSAACGVRVDLPSSTTARLTYTLDGATTTTNVTAHVPLMPALKKPWKTASGKSGKLDKTSLRLTRHEVGDWFEHNGWRISLPKDATIDWPALPHNPYRKDGRAEPAEGRIVVTLPFERGQSEQVVELRITN